MSPEGHRADALRGVVLERFNMSLGGGLQRLADKVFRNGHMGDISDRMLTASLTGVEMGMAMTQMPHGDGRVGAAERFLALGE